MKYLNPLGYSVKNTGLFKLVLNSFLLLPPCLLSAQTTASGQSPIGGWAVKDPFEQKVFIENKGQFDEKNQQAEKIRYGVDDGEMHLYFTEKGLSYHICKYDYKEDTEEGRYELRERIEEDFHEHGPGINWSRYEKYFINKSSFVNVEWLGGNKDAQIEVQEAVQDYYTYSVIKGKESIPVQAKAWKKLIYKNIYPHIDIAYYFIPGSAGIKYNVLVHPGGDLSQVKMKYSGDQGLALDKEGNLIIQSPSSPYTDRAPVSYYRDEEHNTIKTQFIISGKIVSFYVDAYNKSKELIIDPWVSNPGFTTSNKGFGIRVDYNGNCYVYGGGTAGFGTSSAYQVKKFNNAGVLQWTFTTPTLSNGFYGDIATDRVGNTFIGAGFGFNGGNLILKLNPAGTQIAAMAAYTPPGASASWEQWRLSYNQSTNSNTIYIGGGGSEGVQNGKINTNLTGSPSVYNSHISASNHKLKDIVYLAQDDAETFIYSNLSCNSANNGTCADPEDRTIAKVATGAMGTNIWRVNNPSQFMEVGQANYLNSNGSFGSQKSTGLNGAVVGANYLYTFDGGVLTAWNTSNGASAYTVNTGGSLSNFSGIDIDNCGRVYVGLNGVIKRYSSSLVYDISITTSAAVYDLQLDPLNDKKIYVTGNGFVQLIDLPSCPTCISTTQTNVSGCTYGTATATVSDPSATAPLSYSWNTVPVQTSQTATGLVAGTYIVTVTDAASPCPLTWVDTVIITGTYISCGPTVNATGGTLCQGACMNLGSTVTGGTSPYTLSWQPGNLSGATPLVCPTTTTTYTLTATDSTGATGSDTATVVVMPIPTIVVNSPVICAGQTVTLTASGGTTYTWSTGATSTGANTATASPATTTTYTVSGTSTGCSDTAVATVTVNATPTISVNSPSICAGLTATLTASGGTSYTWSAGATPTGINTATASPATTTTYTVTGTSNGCSDTAVATVTVGTLLTITVNSPAICAGQTATLTAGGGTTYTWSAGATSTGTNTASAGPATTTSYTVTGTTGNCSGTATATVTVNPIPSITVNSPTICSGQAATLSANGGTTYTWSAGATATGTNTAMASPATTASYTVSGTSTGCSDTAVATVTVNASPTVSVNSLSLCAGQTATLTAAGANTYSWSAGATATGTNTATATPLTTTSYTVTGTAVNNCTGTAIATVSIVPLPVVTVNSPGICAGQSAVLTAAGASTYTWSAGATSTGTNTATASPTVTTSYTVTGTTGPCSTSAISTVTVNPVPSAAFAGPQSGCSPVKVFFSNTSQNADSYTWYFGDGSSSVLSTPVHDYVQPGSYNVTLIAGNAAGCSDTIKQNALIQVYPNPTAVLAVSDYTVSEYEPVVSFSNLSVNGNTCVLYFGDGDSLNNCAFAGLQHTYKTTGLYCALLYVSTVHNCLDTAEACIHVKPEYSLYIPNAFTPNGDKHNDVFYAYGTNIKEFQMLIFNRWGEEIFESDDLNKGWDGTVKNAGSSLVVQEDVYVYKVLAQDIFNKSHVYVGTVSVAK